MEHLLEIFIVTVLNHIIERVLCWDDISTSNKLLVEDSLHANVDDLHELEVHQN
jgi:hypothetical protein